MIFSQTKEIKLISKTINYLLLSIQQAKKNLLTPTEIRTLESTGSQLMGFLPPEQRSLIQLELHTGTRLSLQLNAAFLFAK